MIFQEKVIMSLNNPLYGGPSAAAYVLAITVDKKSFSAATAKKEVFRLMKTIKNFIRLVPESVTDCQSPVIDRNFDV